MVCPRCIKAVRDEFENCGYIPESVLLGEVNLREPASDDDLDKIGKRLLDIGFEIISNKKSQMIEQVKTEIINIVHYGEEVPAGMNLSTFLARSIGADYSSISNLFSSVEGTTIERYYILQKIEKVKELLIYDELTLSEIAIQLEYSSVQHLSNQFKNTTGMSPTQFKRQKGEMRSGIDALGK